MKKLLLLLLTVGLLSGCETLGKPIDRDRDSRKFDIEYVVELSDCPVGEEIKIWIPYPGDDDHQIVKNVKFSFDDSLKKIKTSKGKGKGKDHNNSMMFVHAKVLKPAGKITVTYSAERFVNAVDLADYSTESGDKASRDSEYLTSSTLCFVTPQIQKEADALGALSPTTLGKARRFYDHILNQMAYSKAGKGWGRGDIYHACEVGEGNCDVRLDTSLQCTNASSSTFAPPTPACRTDSVLMESMITVAIVNQRPRSICTGLEQF